MRVAVIGAGIAGITTTYLLTQQGHNVDVFDRKGIANECSFANGGQLSVSNSKTWNSLSNVKHGLEWIFQKDAPLAMRMDHWSLDKVKWILGFLQAIPHQEKNTRETIQMALRSRELMKQIDIKYDRRNTGIMHIYKSQKALDNAMCDVEKYPEMGRAYVSPREMKKIEPMLEYDSVVGGTFTKDDSTGDIHKFCVELFKRCKGAELLQVNVCNLSLLESKYDAVFVCTGAYTSTLINNSRVYPIKGYSVTVDSPCLPKVSILDDEAKIVTSALGNRFRVAGTAELAGWDPTIDPRRIAPLLKWIKRNTIVKVNSHTEWACLRPMNPDMLPTVERNGKVIVNTGAGHLGWTLCMALAEKAVNLL